MVQADDKSSMKMRIRESDFIYFIESENGNKKSFQVLPEIR